MADEQFDYDVFISHSSNDKPVVVPLAQRLKDDGLRVWLDEWEIKPGDHIPVKIERGLESSRVLLFCEFQDDAGQPTGDLVYLIAKSDGAYQRQQGRDDTGTFAIADQAHARFWMRQPFPVVLVIRNEQGEVRWMDVREPLRRASNDGRTAVQRIAFDGKRLDVMSVRRWRQQALGLEAP